MDLSLWKILVLIPGIMASVCYAVVPTEGYSFSSVIKAFHYNEPGEEVVLFNKDFGYFGYITQQWFSGKGAHGAGPCDKNARIRVYVDNEEEPAIDFSLFLAHGVGTKETVEEPNTPWSTRMFGHLADGGGLFNMFRIPFLRKVKVTIQNDVSTGYLWYSIRGVINLPLMLGSFQIPLNARLRLYKQDKVLAPLEFITISNTTKQSGVLFLVTFNIQSETPQFLEGCVRALIDGSNETTFLSSGTEDFFLSAFNFNRGQYHGFQSGLTFKSNDPKNGTHIAAYRFFIDDPVIFRKSFQLIWRNFETADGPNGCPSQFPAHPHETKKHLWPKRKSSHSSEPAKAHIQSYVWVYEWTSYYAKVTNEFF